MPPQSLLHTPHRVPVALVFYIAVSVVLEIIENTAPCLIAAEIVGAPEKTLLTIVLVLFLGVGTGGHGVEAGILTQDGVIGIPHLRGRLHHLAGNLMSAQRAEKLVPVPVVGNPPSFGTDAAHRSRQRLAIVLMGGKIHGRCPVVEDTVTRIQRRGVIGGKFGLRGGKIGVAVPFMSRRGGRATHILGHPALRPNLHRAIDIALVVLRDGSRRTKGVRTGPLLRPRGEADTH